jgi:hypothetical protein
MTATPAPATGSVQLRLTGSGTITRIDRADANGTTAVRTLPGVLPWTYAGADLIIDDYEAAHGLAAYSADAGVAASCTLLLDTPWLFTPLQPAYSAKVSTITGYSAKRAGRSSIFEPLGRPDTVVITRAMGQRAGSLTAYAGAYADAAAMLDACDRGEVLMLRQAEHAGMDMYFVAKDAGIDVLHIEGGKSLFGINLEYQEVARPAGDLAGALGWTFAGLALSAPDFVTLTRRYATFEDMRLDHRL